MTPLVRKRMEIRQKQHWKLYALLAIAGIIIVGLLASYTASIKFPIGNDAIGYIEDARNLADGKGIQRTPWGVEPYNVDVAPTPHFPPGYPVLITTASFLGLSIEDAAIWITRISWMFLAVAIVFALKPLIGTPLSVISAGISILSPSMYLFGYGAASDIPFVILIAISFGLLFRGYGESPKASLLVTAGVLAGIAYALRNAGTAFYVAIFATYAASVILQQLSLRAMLQNLMWIAVGTSPIIALLIIRNYLVFGAAQPYHLLRDHGVSLIESVRVYLEAFFLDIVGSVSFAKQMAWDFKLLILFSLPVIAAMAWGLWKQWLAKDSINRFAILAMLFFISAGASMLVIAHSYSGLDPGFLVRHIAPYGWLFFALVGLAIGGRQLQWTVKVKAIVCIFVIVMVGTHISYITQDINKEKLMRDAVFSDNNIVVGARSLENDNFNFSHQIKHRLTADQSVLESAESIPPNAFLVSSQGSFLRYILNRPVRNIEYKEAKSLGPLYAELDKIEQALADQRTLYLLVIPSNNTVKTDSPIDWQGKYISELPHNYEVFAQLENFLVIKHK